MVTTGSGATTADEVPRWPKADTWLREYAVERWEGTPTITLAVFRHHRCQVFAACSTDRPPRQVVEELLVLPRLLRCDAVAVAIVLPRTWRRLRRTPPEVLVQRAFAQGSGRIADATVAPLVDDGGQHRVGQVQSLGQDHGRLLAPQLIGMMEPLAGSPDDALVFDVIERLCSHSEYGMTVARSLATRA